VGALTGRQAWAALPALWRLQRHCLGRWAKRNPDFSGPVWELFFETQQHFSFALLSSPSPEFCWHRGRLQWSTVHFIMKVLLLLSKGKPGDDPCWGSKGPCRAPSKRAYTYHGGQSPAAKTTFAGQAYFGETWPFEPRRQKLRDQNLLLPHGEGAKGSLQKARMWLSHCKQLRYRHTSSLSRNLLGERKKDICLASAASSYLGRRKLLMFMFHISGTQNRFWSLKWGSGGTCFKYVTVSERSSLITSLSNTAENGLKPKLGRGGLGGTFHNKTLPALTLVFIAHFNYGAQQAFSQPRFARIYNSYA